MFYFNRLWKKSDGDAVEADFFVPIFLLLVAGSCLMKKGRFSPTDAFFGVSVPSVSERFYFDKNEENSALDD